MKPCATEVKTLEYPPKSALTAALAKLLDDHPPVEGGVVQRGNRYTIWLSLPDMGGHVHISIGKFKTETAANHKLIDLGLSKRPNGETK